MTLLDKRALSERDICTKHITPAMAKGGWDVQTQVRENVHLTHGRVTVRGQLVSRGKGKFADYVLYYKPNVPLPHLLCVTNMMFHGIEIPSNIRHDNTLAWPFRDYGPKDRVDVIVTNPPFGGMEEDGIENTFPATFRTRETADLFLV